MSTPRNKAGSPIVGSLNPCTSCRQPPGERHAPTCQTPFGHGKESSKGEREARLVVLEQMHFVRCLSNPVIERQCAILFGVGERAIRTYMATLKMRWALRPDDSGNPRITREKLTEASVEAMNLAFNRIGKDGKTPDPDVRGVLRAIDRLASLHGLNVQKHEITGADGAPLTVSTADAAAELLKEINRCVSRKATDGEPEKVA